MNPSWQDHLRGLGARIDAGRVLDYGDPTRELAATADGTVLADLSHYAVLGCSGEDAQTFLQSQLSSDVRQAGPAQAQWSSYNSAKGRMLATLLLWGSPGGYHLQLPAELAGPIGKRLAMFILRSRVKLADASDATVRIGVAGPGAEAMLGEALGGVPANPLGVAEFRGATLIRLSQQRFQAAVPPQAAPELWAMLAGHASPVGAPCWDWLEIRDGIPVLFASTQEQFVPQMANLEVLGGVSFRKGCYPGQEVVARTEFLGRLKRRMYLAHLTGDAAPAAGDHLYSPDTEGQASGTVVRAAPAPSGGYDLLAVCQMSSAQSGDVHWNAPDGPRLEFMQLPYQV